MSESIDPSAFEDVPYVKRWLIVDASGEIRMTVVASEEQAKLQMPDKALIEAPSKEITQRTHYYHWAMKRFLARPDFDVQMPATMPLGEVTVVEIPIGTEVSVNGDLIGANEDGTLELEPMVAGEYLIELTNFPFQDARYTVVVQ